MTSRLAYARMLDALEAQVGLVRYALAGDADVTATVASCPGWTIHDLVVHLGAVNWYSGLTAEMIAVFTDTAPDAPVWTFSGPGRADFWPRRQLPETLVHRWDIENALHGAAATPVPEDVAVDTVDEFRTVMRPHMAAHVSPLAVTIRLRGVPHAPETLAAGGLATGALGALEWELPGTDGAGPDSTGVVDVAGPPETLALLLWGRVGAGAAGLEITSDRDGLDAALEAGLST